MKSSSNCFDFNKSDFQSGWDCNSLNKCGGINLPAVAITIDISILNWSLKANALINNSDILPD